MSAVFCQEGAVGGIMELGDETFNMEAAHATMDSDFVPDAHQYNRTEDMQPAGDAFCKQYCGSVSSSLILLVHVGIGSCETIMH